MAIIHSYGHTQDELDRAEGVLVADLNPAALRKSRVASDQVYGLRYRHPPAYKRLSSR